jgi:TolB protein
VGTLLAVLVTTEASAGVDAGHEPVATSAEIAFSSARVFDGESVHGDRIFNFDIYVMNAHGSAQRRLTRHIGVDRDPSWSPDGARIVYESDWPTEEMFLRTMKANGRGDRGLGVRTGTAGRDPAWSPDGRKIVFAYTDDFTTYEIHVVNADGTRERRLTRDGYDLSPTWSPDGRWIAFARSRHFGNTNIYVMKADGTRQRQLTQTPPSDHDPAWSPDGQQIAFWSGNDVKADIYVINADGTGLHRVTSDGHALDGGIAWSSDGQQIAFESGRTGNGDIYVMDADGTGQRRLTRSKAEDRDPSWQPIP